MKMPLLKYLQFWKKQEVEDDVPTHRLATTRAKAKRLGQYEIVREIGRGSMGVVYLGRDTVTGRDVALKTMNLADEFDQKTLGDAKERFLREAEFLNTLNHPDIVTFYGVGEERGMAYIAMEFLKGVELTEYTQPGKLLPLRKALEIVARAAEALGHAHEQKIVHRDVKPGNIMYDAENDVVKVADFGISRLTNLSRTRAGLVLGSPIYMSPEQVMGQPINGLSDLFSLGSTFYQMVSGRLPFEDETDMKVMFRIARDSHTDIRSVKPDVPPRVRAIIDRALAKDTAQRYQTGSEMAQDMRECAAAL